MPDFQRMAADRVADAKRIDQHGPDPLRRGLLATMAGVAGMAAMAPLGRVHAQVPDEETSSGAESEEVFNSYNRPRSFLNGEMDNGAPWQAKKTGNFDLEDPAQNHLASLKMTTNLVGERTYIPMLARMLLARPDEPGALALGIASMFTWQLQVPDPAEFGETPEGTAVMRSMYTATYLDPVSMKPVSELKNPLTGKIMKLEDYLFIENFLSFPKGGSRFVEELQFANDDPNAPKPKNIQNWGDELILFMGGIYSKPGIHQPRFTENNWTSKLDEVMDPDAALIGTQYALMGVNKAYEKPWTGYTTSDPEILCTLARGKKVHSAEDLPDIHKTMLAERYPDRL